MAGTDDEPDPPPERSRLERGGVRRYRVLGRGRSLLGRRDYQRQRRLVPLTDLIAALIARHGLTDELRKRLVCVHWPDIAGPRIASKTVPVSCTDGVLQVAASSSTWVHEMQFLKAELVAKIDAWLRAEHAWLEAGPLVTEIRVTLGSPRREPLVDVEHARRVRARIVQRLRAAPAGNVAAPTTAERAAICSETSAIADPELRALVEAVRLTWNR